MRYEPCSAKASLAGSQSSGTPALRQRAFHSSVPGVSSGPDGAGAGAGAAGAAGAAASSSPCKHRHAG